MTALHRCLLLLLLQVAAAQRFLREGFSNQMDSDFRGELKLDENQELAGMSREMFLMQDVAWELKPPPLVVTGRSSTLPGLHDDDNEGEMSSRLRSHVMTHLKDPVRLQLTKKRGKYGLIAKAKMENGKKLRAFWRQATTSAPQTTTAGAASPLRLRASDFTRVSYDEAVRSRLFTVEFEVQLPPISLKKGDKPVSPSVVYQIPMEPGSLNPKAMVPRGAGHVHLYPNGRSGTSRDGTSNFAKSIISMGVGHVGMPAKAGLVDSGWARGRQPIFCRGGRPVGLM